MNLLCPVCGLQLNREDRRYVCANHHSFDIARQGHVNLLVVQQKRVYCMVIIFMVVQSRGLPQNMKKSMADHG